MAEASVLFLFSMDVAAMFSNGRQDPAGNPFAEGFGLGFAGPEEEGMETGLVDDFTILFYTRSPQIEEGLSILVQVPCKVVGTHIQHRANLIDNKLGFPLSMAFIQDLIHP